jgi:hypothetical protein
VPEWLSNCVHPRQLPRSRDVIFFIGIIASKGACLRPIRRKRIG